MLVQSDVVLIITALWTDWELLLNHAIILLICEKGLHYAIHSIRLLTQYLSHEYCIDMLKRLKVKKWTGTFLTIERIKDTVPLESSVVKVASIVRNTYDCAKHIWCFDAYEDLGHELDLPFDWNNVSSSETELLNELLMANEEPELRLSCACILVDLDEILFFLKDYYWKKWLNPMWMNNLTTMNAF